MTCRGGRFTADPTTSSGINCSLSGGDNKPLEVELIVPRVPRSDQAKEKETRQSSPFKYLTTLHKLQELSIDPMDVVAGYWKEVASGDTYMAMELHLESQDRLLGRGSDSALLNAIRSVESLYAAQNSGAVVERVSVREKIDNAVSGAGDVGAHILDAWPELHKIGQLRREVAHGKERPSAGFGIRCLGGAMALQWIQRCLLLTSLGISHTAARSIVLDNFQYRRDLKTLRYWNIELGG